MSRVMTLALLAVLAAALVVPAGASAGSPALQMLKRINKVRRNHHLPKLHGPRSPRPTARRYSRHQMRHHYFGHASRIHASGRYHTLGEILEIHRSYNPALRSALRN